MKKVLFTIIAVLSVFLTACNKNEPATLEIAASNVDFTFEEGEGSVDFQTSSDIVSATVDQDWCRTTIRRTTVVVRVDANKGKDARVAKLTVKNQEGLVKTVDVSQKGVRYIFDAEDVDFTAKGGETEFQYYGPKMAVVVPDEAADWLTAEVTDSALKIICDANDAVSARSAKVGFAISSKSGYITVSQAANDPYIIFTPAMEEINVKSDPSDNIYTYKTNSPTTPAVTVDKSYDWISVTVTPDTKVAGTGTIKVHADLNNSLNPRECSFQWSILKNASVKGTVKVKQAAAEKIITHFELVDASGAAVTGFNSAATGMEYSATIKTNAAGYTASANVDWITVAPAKLDNPEYKEVSQAIKFTVAASTEGAARTGKVTLTIPDMDPVVVTVTQDKYIGVKLTVKTITYDGAVTHMVPSDPNFIYLVDTMEKSDFDTFKSLEEVYEYEISYCEFLGSMYGFTLEEVIDLIAYQGEDDDDMTGYLDPETDYVVYAIPVSAKGELIGAVTTASYRTKEFPYKYLGEGTYTDDIITSLFGKPNITLPVDVYELKSKAGVYYMDTPYGPEFMAAFFGISVEEAEQYEGGNWKSTMVEINASNGANKVVMGYQALGFKAGSDGWIYAGSLSGAYGTLANGIITFPTRGLLIGFSPTTPGFYANINGKTALVLPTTKAAQPAKGLKSRSGKTAKSKHHLAKMPAKSFSSKDFHIMAIPFEK